MHGDSKFIRWAHWSIFSFFLLFYCSVILMVDGFCFDVFASRLNCSYASNGQTRKESTSFRELPWHGKLSL